MSSTPLTPSQSSPGPLLSPGDGVLESNFGNRWWRIQNLYKIRDKDKRLVNLRFNDIQLGIIKEIIPFLQSGQPIRHFKLKYRQGGVSTFWLLYWLDETIFTPNTITGILSHKNDSLQKLMKIIRIAWQYMPLGIRPDLVEDAKERLAFVGTNSEIFGALSIRSTALHNLHISEWCLCDDVEVQATLGATSPTTNITGESTGNGIGNDGYETYQDGKKGENGFKSSFSPWFIQKEYRNPLNGLNPAKLMGDMTQEEKKLKDLMKKDYGLVLDAEQLLWRRITKKKMKSLFPQEFPETELDAFLASGIMFFDAKKIMALYNEARDWHDEAGPVDQDPQGDWMMFHKPEKYHVYAAGADTSEGANDHCCLKIVDVTAQREVLVYRARVGVKKFYSVCDHFGRLFNNALLGVERNNHGHAVLLGLQEDKKYPNLYYTEKRQNRAVAKDIPEKKYGWETTGQSRPIMLDQLKANIEGDPEEDEDHFSPLFTVYDKTFLSEALTFQEVDGKFQAVAGKFDDDVFATAIMNQMFQTVLRRRTVSSPTGIITGGPRSVV